MHHCDPGNIKHLYLVTSGLRAAVRALTSDPTFHLNTTGLLQSAHPAKRGPSLVCSVPEQQVFSRDALNMQVFVKRRVSRKPLFTDGLQVTKKPTTKRIYFFLDKLATWLKAVSACQEPCRIDCHVIVGEKLTGQSDVVLFLLGAQLDQSCSM